MRYRLVYFDFLYPFEILIQAISIFYETEW